MFQLTTLFENDIVKIKQSKVNQFLSIFWKKHPDGAEFKDTLRELPSLITGMNLRFLISDSRKVLFLDISSQNFLAQQVYPLLAQEYKSFIAYVVSPASYGMMDIYRISDLLKSNADLKERLETNIFLSLEDAQDWIMEQGVGQLLYP